MGNASTKVALRNSIIRIRDTPNIDLKDETFWSQLWLLPESVDDIFTFFTPKDIRLTLQNNPSNIATLITKMAGNLINQVNSTAMFEESTLLNCLRILTRVMPLVFEMRSDSFENDIFWKGLNPLGTRLIDAVLDSLFLVDFSFSLQSNPSSEKISLSVWEPGVGSVAELSASSIHKQNRIESLRLLLTLTSATMYYSIEEVLEVQNKWIEYLTSKPKDSRRRKAIMTLLCSLLNTVLTYNPAGKWNLPYNYVLFSDPDEHLATLSLHIMVVFLSHPNSGQLTTSLSQCIQESKPSNSISSDDDNIDSNLNIYHYFFSRIHRPEDFALMTDCFCRLLTNPIHASNSYLPGSTKRFQSHQELLLLLWKLLSANPVFLKSLIEIRDGNAILEITGAILFYIIQCSSDEAHVGFILLHMFSCERSYALLMNKEFDGNWRWCIPYGNKLRIPSFTGCWGDWLVVVTASLAMDRCGLIRNEFSQQFFYRIVNSMLPCLDNIAPYIQKLCVVASNKLVSLLLWTSRPSFTFSTEWNWTGMMYIVDIILRILSWQYQGNPHLVYCLLQRFSSIEKLAHQNFEEGLKLLEKKLAKETLKENNGENLLEDSKKLSNESIDLNASDSTSESNLEEVILKEESIPKPSEGFSHDALEKSERILDKGKETIPSSNFDPTHIAELNPLDFKPTSIWFETWYRKQFLPNLDLLLVSLSHLLRPVHQFVSGDGSVEVHQYVSEQEIDEFISKKTSVVGILPPPPPIHIRHFVEDKFLKCWQKSYLWSKVFIEGKGQAISEGPINLLRAGSSGSLVGSEASRWPSIWASTKVRLFRIQLV